MLVVYLMKGYKTDDGRLAPHFKVQRDNWKERALLKQKENRALEAKLEYTTHSRDKWKKKAIETQGKVKTLEKLLKGKEAEIEQLKKKILTPALTQTGNQS